MDSRGWTLGRRDLRSEIGGLDVAIDEVAGLARAGLDGSRVWEPVTGSLPPGTDVIDALAGGSTPSVGRDAATRRALVAVERLAREAGASRADLLEALGGALSDQQDLADARETALAGPRATARVLVWLPVLGLVLGTAIGAEPLRAIAAGGIASVAAALGVGLMVGGWLWTRSLLASVIAADDGALVAVSLLAAALETGLSLPAGLNAVGRVGQGAVERRLATVGGRLGRGMTWEQAWAGTEASGRARRTPWRRRREATSDTELLAACRRALTLAWTSGIAASPLLKALIARWRRRVKHQATVASARIGVTLMLPLGLCYLPAFVALGLVPVIVSLASNLGLGLG
ncbi:MAG: type II secretion system F family protein [Bifidobacteriaceae bacterium]|nr:type II secretion system F family protein [Bifidobacteriaceae bacterium]